MTTPQLTHLRCAPRGLVGNLVFARAAIARFARGIGATMATRSLRQRGVLEALKVYAPGQPVNLAASGSRTGATASGSTMATAMDMAGLLRQARR